MAKISEPRTVEVIGYCRTLGFVKSELSGGVVVQIPDWKAFKSSLSETDESQKVKAYFSIKKYFEKRGGEGKPYAGRWTLWHTGTIKILGKLGQSPASTIFH